MIHGVLAFLGFNRRSWFGSDSSSIMTETTAQYTAGAHSITAHGSFEVSSCPHPGADGMALGGSQEVARRWRRQPSDSRVS